MIRQHITFITSDGKKFDKYEDAKRWENSLDAYNYVTQRWVMSLSFLKKNDYTLFDVYSYDELVKVHDFLKYCMGLPWTKDTCSSFLKYPANVKYTKDGGLYPVDLDEAELAGKLRKGINIALGIEDEIV